MCMCLDLSMKHLEIILKCGKTAVFVVLKGPYRDPLYNQNLQR